MRLAVIASLFATPCLCAPDWPATPEQIAALEFLGGHGCILGDGSLTAAVNSGLDLDGLQIAALSAQAIGQAKVVGSNVVFDASICTIRLPSVETS